MGFLELIIGPMFSGKTSELIKRYHETLNSLQIKPNKNNFNLDNDISILAINYDKDTRYGMNQIITHDKIAIDCISINEFSELYQSNNISSLSNAKYIFINEAQFFQDIKTWVLNQVETYDKNVILCGLDSDFKREKFGEILDLIPHATKITKLCGQCTKCENKAIYTHRISNETNQEVIGANNYIPVCRSCYLSLHNDSIDSVISTHS